MRVLLVNTPDAGRPVVRDMAGGLGFDGGDSLVLPPLELALMAASLRQQGHEARIADCQASKLSAEAVFAMAVDFKADWLVAAVSLPTLESDCAFLKEASARTGARVAAKTGIAFEPLLSEILEKSGALLCVCGECDLNIGAILSGEDRRSTAWLEAGRLVMGPSTMIEDLDQLPLAARDLLPNECYRYPLLAGAVTTIQTSRGCPFPCAYYCPYPLVQGSRWRAMSPARVLREIEQIVRLGIHGILFRDASFTFDKKRVLAICRGIIDAGFKLNWWCETRIDCLEPDLLAVMKQAGCRGINVGVESGDPGTRARAKQGLSLEKLKAIRNAAARTGLGLHFLLMVGLPGETRRSLYQTYHLLKSLRPETMGVCLVTPYPGTPLYHEAREKGWIESSDWKLYGGHTAVMHTDTLSSRDCSLAYASLWELFRLLKKGWPGLPRRLFLEQRLKSWSEK